MTSPDPRWFVPSTDHPCTGWLPDPDAQDLLRRWLRVHTDPAHITFPVLPERSRPGSGKSYLWRLLGRRPTDRDDP